MLFRSSPEVRSKGFTINTAIVEYETEKCNFCHVDCPGHVDYAKNTIIATTRMDIGVLVVGNEGPGMQTREHILLARHTGVPEIIVYLNKVDCVKDPTDLEVISMEVTDMLTQYGYNGKEAKVINGSALCALEGTKPDIGEKSIKALLDAMEAVKLPPRDLEGKFMFQVDHTTTVAVRSIK